MPQLSKYIDLASVVMSTSEGECKVDSSDCEGVLFIGVPATTVARIWSMALKAGATTTGFVTCASTHTHASSAAANVVVVTDVHKPAQRWIAATLSSSTATPSYTLGIKYGLRLPPVTFSATAGLSAASGGIIRAVSPTSST